MTEKERRIKLAGLRFTAGGTSATEARMIQMTPLLNENVSMNRNSRGLARIATKPVSRRIVSDQKYRHHQGACDASQLNEHNEKRDDVDNGHSDDA
jgi:hypothetical protein